ncbi:2-succinyl-6-hydroxy-2,4-cyclohexadiene-1-carboxylate synthase [Pantoea alhagi]|uniref:2-succinyl-6-hydroxy-2, 4-cyclohexadiene-1-carboxylate synthase n=1 Tax=Pantoea alhagi TaxID=1891675 RepID=A0A1W6B951_9GAMM|nr:alpha/beta hydrolase [Pantoea alhagi]ARJ43597.1 2-succinyl-6-hydroxy-2,4-cyclohexadiene-1-carboxylate synthase [Pantoea alhagi]
MAFTDTGKGFPVLLGHSYLFDNKMWTPQISALTTKYRVIAPDLWGHGASPSLPSRVESLSDLAADHLNLMTYLGITEFAVVGLSVGGMWGAELAALAPDRVRALMLFDTFLGSETTEAQAQYFHMLNAVEKAGAITSPLLDYIVSQFYSASASADQVTALTSYLSSLGAQQLRDSIVPVGKMIFGRADRMHILDSIQCPTHVATGERDLPRPLSEGKAMAERLACEFTTIPQAGHISNRENPAFVTTLILDFLSSAIAD